MTKINCLLISPLAADRLLVEEALRRGFCDFQVTQVADASSWQEALAAGDFGLGIIAETLPWAETGAVVRGLKTLRPECPVIMLAAPEREETAWEALLSGIDDYVLKSPEEMRRLPGVIRAARYRARRLAGEPFRTGEADFKVLFDAVPEVVFVHDPETGSILDANQEACDRLGYSLEEFKNLQVGAISLGEPPFNQEEALRGIRKTVQEGPQSLEWLGRTKAGKPIWIEINSKRVVIGGQERVLSFGRNISRHKQVQEALRETETRYETLLDNAGDAIFIHDTAGRLLQVNDAACKLLGYSRAEMQQMSLNDIDAPTHPGIREKIRESRRQGHVFVETALKRRDGAAVPVELSSRFVEYAGLPVAFSIARDIAERKEAEEKLRQSEILYRSIFETTGTATCIDDENTILRLVNAECTKLTGYTREELEGKKSWTEFIVPEDLEKLKGYHRLRRQDSDAAPKTYTLRWKDRQGRIRDMLATIALIPGTKNSVASLLDITARQQAEKALRESEVRHRLLVETMNDGLGMQDENGNITYVNRRLCEILGYAKEELLGRHPGDFMDAANQDILKEQMERRKNGQNRTYEIAWMRKDGTKVYTGISPVPMFDAAGKFQGSFAVIADLTLRQQAERALRASEEKYRAIFENTGTATAILEADNIISLVNAEFVKLSGYSREEVEGKKKWMEFAAVADQPMMKEYHRQRRLDPPQAPRNYEARFVDRQGEVKDMLVTAGMIPGTNKSVGSLLDITARKKAEQDLLLERKKFQILTENSPFALVMIGKDGTFKYVNPKFSELFGYSLADVPDGKTWFRKAFPNPTYRHQVISAWVNDLERYQPRENMPQTFTVTCKDGTEKIISFISLQLDDGDHLTTCEDITEQHRAVEAVKRSEQHFRLLIENSMFHLRIIEPDGAIRYESPTLERFLGYQPAEQEGFNAFDFVHPDDQAIVREKMRQLLENPELVMSAEMRYRHRDGAWRWLDVKGKNLLHEPMINGIILNGQDITERKQAAEAVKQSEQRFRLLMENSMVHFGVIDAQGTVLYENPTMERILGYEFGELLGRNSFEFTHPEDLARSQEILMNLLESPGTVFTTVVRYRHKDGSWRFLEVNAKNLLGEPLIRGIVVNAHDITQRTEALEALRQSEERYRAIVEDQTELVTRFLPDGTFTFANETLCRFFGKSREELIGINFYPFLPDEEKAVVRKNLAALGRDNPISTHEYPVFMPDGQVIWHQWTTRAIFDNQGRIIEFQGVGQDITERKRAEEALRQAEAEKSLILKNMSEMVTYRDREHRILLANPAAAHFHGLTPKEMVGRCCYEIYHQRHTPCPDCRVIKVVDTGQAMEQEIVKPDGRILSLRTSPVKDEKCRIVGYVVVATDITARKKTEEALGRAEEEKSIILKNMSEKVLYYDRDFRILWANQAMADYLGLTPEEMVGRFCYETIHRRPDPCPDCPAIKAMETSRAVETEIIKPDGQIFSYKTSPVKDESGEIQGIVVVVSDITARKKAEEAIKASEEKMRLVIESSPVGIRISQQGRHIYVNPALVRMFGYGDAGEIVGWPVGLLFAPDESEIPPQKMTANPGGKPGPSFYEALGLKEDGARIEVQVWQTEIDYQGEPARLDFVLDISEAKALRSQLLQSQKMEAIGTLAGGIAHDFNNILLPILINAEMVQEGLPPDSPFRQKLARVIKACQRAIDLVKQILAFSRHEELKLSPVRLAAIIKDSLRLLRSTLPATIEITQHLESDRDTVLADPTQMQQVLINLCTNAAHALGDRGGVIDISLQEVEAETAKVSRPQDPAPRLYLQVTVRDNGAGMDPATKERIFDPYFTTKKPEEGTGLGLAVVHGIVKKHGGVISVESELGKGTVFHILLPRVEAEAIPETGGFMPLPQGRERILLVDDDPEIVATLQQLMEHLGYQVVALTDSVEALNSFRAEPQGFDLVITDQTMQKLTGEDLAREILGLRPDIPIILCTGFSEAVSPEKARAIGIRELIIKPVATRVMAETIRRVIPKHDLS